MIISRSPIQSIRYVLFKTEVILIFFSVYNFYYTASIRSFLKYSESKANSEGLPCFWQECKIRPGGIFFFSGSPTALGLKKNGPSAESSAFVQTNSDFLGC